MASSKKLPVSKTLTHQLKSFLVDVFKQKNLTNPKLVVAFSGGLDSVVLLHLLVECQKNISFQLQAQHVHHGLSPNADAWADFCQNVCTKLKVPLTISKVKVNKNSGLGIEAAAREERYKALLAADVDFICLAHHQDDQAETLLLQLARGAGVKGLAGMSAANKKLLRPLLNIPRVALELYAKQHQLAWIEDESNVDTLFDRNFMRHEVLPILAKQYPAIKQTISRAAQHMAEASELLDELATLDIASCVNSLDSENQTIYRQINLQQLRQLSALRINNALRWWLVQHGLELPSRAQLQQITQQLMHAKADAAINIKVHQNFTLQRYHGRAYLVENMPSLAEDIQLQWRGEDVMTLPDQSKLMFSKKLGEGIAMRHLETKKLKIQYRQGGETIKPVENRPTRRLNALLQVANIPPWLRARLPLLFIDADLVLLPDIAVDVRFKSKPNETGLQVHWQFN